MIIGAHVMLHSTNDRADIAFLTDVLKLPSVNAGGGYMIFGVPPAEVSVHGSDRNGDHQLFLMCEDIAAFTGNMTRHGIAFSTPVRQGWGTVTEITLPGGGKLGVYQPRHPRPETAAVAKPSAKKGASPRKAVRKAQKKSARIARPAKKKAKSKKRSR